MAQGNVNYTFTSGTNTMTLSTSTTMQGVSNSMSVGSLIRKNKRKYPPVPCSERRGGPRSKIFCEVFAHIPHEVHCGRSEHGNWYSWKEDDDE